MSSIQLVFSNFYLGIALGALDYATKYTTTNTRAWPFGGDVSLTHYFLNFAPGIGQVANTQQNKEKPTDEFYILSTYGNFLAHLRAATALADKAGLEADSVYGKYSDKRDGLTAQERGDLAEWIASVKVVTTDTGLRVTAGVFEVTGAKATASKVGLDRFWRDLRTHTLHDPVAFKNRELGRYQLLGEIPEPTWYT